MAIIVCEIDALQKEKKANYSDHNTADLEVHLIINPLIGVELGFFFWVRFRMRPTLKYIHDKLFSQEANLGKLLVKLELC